MNKRDILFFSGGVILGFLLFVQYGKYRGRVLDNEEKVRKCNELLEAELQTLRPSDDFDIETYKKEFMEKCLKS